MIYVVTRRLLAYYYADPVYMLRVSRYHGITIVSTHSRPTPRLPVFILQTFYMSKWNDTMYCFSKMVRLQVCVSTFCLHHVVVCVGVGSVSGTWL